MSGPVPLNKGTLNYISLMTKDDPHLKHGPVKQMVTDTVTAALAQLKAEGSDSPDLCMKPGCVTCFWETSRHSCSSCGNAFASVGKGVRPLFVPIADDNNRTLHLEVCLLCSDRCAELLWTSLPNTTMAQRRLGHASHVPDSMEFLWHAGVFTALAYILYTLFSSGHMTVNSAMDLSIWVLITRCFASLLLCLRDFMWVIEASVGSLALVRYWAAVAHAATLPVQLAWSGLVLSQYPDAPLAFRPVTDVVFTLGATNGTAAAAAAAATATAHVAPLTADMALKVLHLLPLATSFIEIAACQSAAAASKAVGASPVGAAARSLLVLIMYGIFTTVVSSANDAVAYPWVKEWVMVPDFSVARYVLVLAALAALVVVVLALDWWLVSLRAASAEHELTLQAAKAAKPRQQHANRARATSPEAAPAPAPSSSGGGSSSSSAASKASGKAHVD